MTYSLSSYFTHARLNAPHNAIVRLAFHNPFGMIHGAERGYGQHRGRHNIQRGYMSNSTHISHRSRMPDAVMAETKKAMRREQCPWDTAHECVLGTSAAPSGYNQQFDLRSTDCDAQTGRWQEVHEADVARKSRKCKMIPRRF